jgi:hypothetical protein
MQKLLLSLLVFQLLIIQVTAQASAGPCPGAAGNGIIGYTSITAMDADQQSELLRIRDGGVPRPPYVFTICPGQALDFTVPSAPFQPVLSGSIFTCGTTGAAAGNCMFVGGDTQIIVQDSAVTGYPLQTIEFRGITFAAFTGAAIAGGAGAGTTVVLRDVIFEVCILSCIVYCLLSFVMNTNIPLTQWRECTEDCWLLVT